MPTIFISYRRSDTDVLAHSIVSEFTRRSTEVIFDVTSIPPGANFKQYLLGELRRCDALLAILGPEWSNQLDVRQQPKSIDYVRLEIETAFSLGVKVIPVLTGGAQLPSKEILPLKLKKLPTLQAFTVRTGPDFENHLSQLVRKTEEVIFADRGERWLEDPDPNAVLVIGPSGVGKTTMAKRFSGGYEDLHEYLVSMNEEVFLSKNHVRFVTTPGQRIERGRWNTIKKHIEEGKFQGIVFMVAHGHHARKTGLSEDERSDIETFLKGHVRKCWKKELKSLQYIRGSILANTRKCWLLVAVTKQDLWFSEEQAVRSHYRERTIGKELQQLESQLDPASFRCEFWFGSLIIRNLATDSGELLKATAEGYDAKLQDSSLKELGRILDELHQWADLNDDR